MDFIKKIPRAELLIVLFIFLFHLYFRFDQMEQKSQFTWDQVNNAWVAKDIIVDHKLPILGMEIKQNSGFRIGPLYYYPVAFFYWIFNLDPIASAVFAGFSSIVTFFILYFLIREMFGGKIAIIAIILHTFSFYIIILDRVQWPVNFITPLSIGIFYALRKIILGDTKKIILLGFLLGLSLNVHFTAVFFFIAVLACMPLLIKSGISKKNYLFSILIFLIFSSPLLIGELSNHLRGGNLTSYFNSYFHGLHLTRVLQLKFDAFLEFETILNLKALKPFEFLLPFLFFVLYKGKTSKDKKLTIYLTALWLIIPWFVLASYSGEISNYYFTSTRPVALIIFSYLLIYIYNFHNKVSSKIIVLVVLLLYCAYNLGQFLKWPAYGISHSRIETQKRINSGEKINFTEGDPDSYFYYVSTRNNKK